MSAPAPAPADARARAAGLPCWSAPVEPEPVTGGITNLNFVVSDGGQRYFVRIGEDIPIHGVMRFNEVAAAMAAERAGVTPAVIYTEPGAIVTRFVEGRTLGPEDLREPERLDGVVALIRACHHEIPKYLRGPVLMFWVFHVVCDYAAALREGHSPRVPLLNELQSKAEILERTVGPIEVVFGHNDLLAANFIDDGERLWLVDWDYAGFNSPLFDLANLASNNEYEPDMEQRLLTAYFGEAAGDGLCRRFAAMKCASLLRETMWSMVQEIHSTLDFDYAAYTDENMTRFVRAYDLFLEQS